MVPVRLTADERRVTVLAAAVTEFARSGYAGTSTEAIAQRAGISQPYLFRLFGTKKDLFIATYDLVADRIVQAMTEACGDRTGEEAIVAMGSAYLELGLVLDPQRLAAFYAMADVLALPSRTDCHASVQVEALLAGVPTQPDRWHASLVTFDTDWARFTEGDLEEARERLTRLARTFELRLAAAGPDAWDAPRTPNWTLREIADHLTGVRWYAGQLGRLS